NYGRAKLRDDPSTRSYVQDLDVARKATIDAAEGEYERGVELLPRLWRYSLLRCSLASQADNYPDPLFETLVDVGRAQEAIGLVELLTKTERKAKILFRLALRIGGQPGRQQESRQLILRAIEVAREIEHVSSRAVVVGNLVSQLARAGQYAQASDLA